MTRRADRERLGRELEARGFVPNRAEQAAIRREAEQVARRVQQRRDAAQARKATLESKVRKLREDPLDWLNDE